MASDARSYYGKHFVTKKQRDAAQRICDRYANHDWFTPEQEREYLDARNIVDSYAIQRA